MARTRAQLDREQAGQRGRSVAQEVLIEDGWLIGPQTAHHPLWGWHGPLSATCLNNTFRRSITTLSRRGLVHGGGRAQC